jgi:MFS family permease
VNKYKSFLRNYYLSSALYDFIFAYAIYNVLFNIRGLSIFQISLLLSWWALTSVLFEIPSGALADHWSRKKLLVIAPLIKSLCFVAWFVANGNFYLYALGFLFWSIGSSFVSGTTESLLYDELTAFGKKEEYEKILSRKNFYFHISLAVSGITGGIIAYYNLDWALIFSIIPLILSSYFAFLIQETPKIKSTEEVHYLDHIKIAIKEIKQNKLLLYFFAFAVGIDIMGGLEEFDQLYYQLAGLPLFAFGFASFLWSMSNSLGSYFAHKLKNVHWIYYGLPFISFVLLLFVGFFPSIAMIGVLLLAYLTISPLIVLIESKIQHNIKTSSRATVTSFSRLLINLSGVILAPVFGLVAKVWNLQVVYIAVGFFLFVFAIWVITKKKYFSSN